MIIFAPPRREWLSGDFCLVHLRRIFVSQVLMRALIVVFIDVVLDSLPEFSWSVILIHIDIIAFKASEPALNNDVINYVK